VSASTPSIILASTSPRRRDILSALGIAFEARPSYADEEGLAIEDDVEFVRAAALAKLQSALGSSTKIGAYVLAADTVVSVDDRRLGKPADDQDAIRMLELLVGRDHLVWTAIALGRVGRGLLESRVVQTRVWFREANRAQLERYVATGESRDKAGAYAIQGLASGFVTRLEGSYTNVVGLPAAEVVAMLLDHGALGEWP
jgi:septum formation protein